MGGWLQFSQFANLTETENWVCLTTFTVSQLKLLEKELHCKDHVKLLGTILLEVEVFQTMAHFEYELTAFWITLFWCPLHYGFNTAYLHS
jgi:hypothetical protein